MQGLSSRAKCPIRSLSSTDDENERIGHLAREDVQGPPPPLGLLDIKMFFTRISVTANWHFTYILFDTKFYIIHVAKGLDYLNPGYFRWICVQDTCFNC